MTRLFYEFFFRFSFRTRPLWISLRWELNKLSSCVSTFVLIFKRNFSGAYTNLGISNKKRPIYLVRKYISIFTQVSGPIKLEIEFHLFRSCSRCNWRHLCTWQLEIRYTLSGISDIQEGVSRWSCASIQHGYRVRYASNLFIIHSIFACWSLT